MQEKTKQEFLVGALIGGIVGAAAALIFTPVSGAKLRNELNSGFGYLEQPKKKRKTAATKKEKKGHTAHAVSHNNSHSPKVKKPRKKKAATAAATH